MRDALGHLSTTAAISLVRDLIITEKMSNLEADSWLTSLAFINRPTEEMIAASVVRIDLVDHDFSSNPFAF